MKVNIYYGGRGLIDDPTIYAMNKIMTVLEELNIKVSRYNLYEDKRGISVLPKTLKEADAVVLAASVEWMGIGGLMWQFLDSCWLYGDKEKMKSLYMMPLVISTTYGEKDAQFTLVKAWEMLRGIPCDGICATLKVCVFSPPVFSTSLNSVCEVSTPTNVLPLPNVSQVPPNLACTFATVSSVVVI